MLRPTPAIALATGLVAATSLPIAAETLPSTSAATSAIGSKDVGPTGTCDAHAKGSPAWQTCIGGAVAGMPDTELFYAGYWLARTGRYAEALRYLSLAKVKDERILTYIGFATRKLGDVEGALPYYAGALSKNPDFVVARAYLGEAYLAKGEPAKARAELAEIARRCGETCPAHVDLAGHIAAFEADGRRG